METVKTTILLRKDVHQNIVERFGSRNLSKMINEFLFKTVIKQKTKSMFGVDKGMKPFVREHHDRF